MKKTILFILFLTLVSTSFAQDWRSEKKSLINAQINRLSIEFQNAIEQIASWEGRIEQIKITVKRPGYPESLKNSCLESLPRFKANKKKAKQHLAETKDDLKEALEEEELIFKAEDEGDYLERTSYYYEF